MLRLVLGRLHDRHQGCRSWRRSLVAPPRWTSTIGIPTYVDAVIGAAARVIPSTVLGATRRFGCVLWLQVGGTSQWSSTDGEEPAAAVLVERRATEIAVASARAAGLHPGFALTTGSALVRQLVAPTTAVQARGAYPMHGHGLCRASTH